MLVTVWECYFCDALTHSFPFVSRWWMRSKNVMPMKRIRVKCKCINGLNRPKRASKRESTKRVHYFVQNRKLKCNAQIASFSINFFFSFVLRLDDHDRLQNIKTVAIKIIDIIIYNGDFFFAASTVAKMCSKCFSSEVKWYRLKSKKKENITREKSEYRSGSRLIITHDVQILWNVKFRKYLAQWLGIEPFVCFPIGTYCSAHENRWCSGLLPIRKFVIHRWWYYCWMPCLVLLCYTFFRVTLRFIRNFVNE